jgi:hypothetical protein
MYRKSMIALAAVATVAATAFTATDASAKPLKWKGGYYHHHHGVGFGAAALGLGIIGAATVAAATPRCYEVINRYGEIVTRCRY